MKFVVRQLLKSPGYFAVSVLTLALGIGLNTAMFSFLNSLLLNPSPFPDSDALIRLFRVKGNTEFGAFSAAEYAELKRESAEVGRFAGFRNAEISLTDSVVSPEWMFVSSDLFDVLGVRPELGRLFRLDEETKGNDRVVLISHRLWQTQFGGAKDVMGKTILGDQQLYEIVGVLPPSANDRRLFGTIGIFSPLVVSRGSGGEGNHRDIQIVGRRAVSISKNQAETTVASWGARWAMDFPAGNIGVQWRVEGLPTIGMSSTGKWMLAMIQSLAVFVLLIACSNLANFSLARTLERSHEFSISAALGASRWHLLRPMVLEALVLGVCGGIGALVVVDWTTHWMRSMVETGGGPSIDFSLDTRVLSFALGVSVFTLMVFTLAPALFLRRIDANQALKSGARGATPGRKHQRLRRVLIGGQFAISMVLLACAGFFVRGTMNLAKISPGWNADNVLQGSLRLPESKFADGVEINEMHQIVLERVQAMPGIEAVSLSHSLPYEGFRDSARIRIEGLEVGNPGQEPTIMLNGVSPSFFDVTGIRKISGRIFNDADVLAAPPVVLVNETVARVFFPGQSPLGRRIAFAVQNPPQWIEIVGVVGDVRSMDVAKAPSQFQIYRPMAQSPRHASYLSIRSSGTTGAGLIPSVRSALEKLDPDLKVHEWSSAQRMVERVTSQMGLVTQLLIVFATLGLLLAAIGIFGVMARSVAQRRGEIGVRMALGAQVVDITRLILGYGLRIAGIGSALGFLGAVGATRFLRTVLPGMESNSSWVIGGAVGLLMLTALLACYWPARKAAQVEPGAALRSL